MYFPRHIHVLQNPRGVLDKQCRIRRVARVADLEHSNPLNRLQLQQIVQIPARWQLMWNRQYGGVHVVFFYSPESIAKGHVHVHREGQQRLYFHFRGFPVLFSSSEIQENQGIVR